MKYRKLGNSDIDVSVVTLGAWAIGGWMWGGQDEAEAIDAIRASVDSGVNCIDTAAVYGFGDSEILVGKAVADCRGKVKIFTKFGLRWDLEGGSAHLKTTDNQGKPLDVKRCAKADSVIYECENSLKRLGTDYIDLYQIHWPDPNTPVDETFKAVEKLIADGKVIAAGVSNYDTGLLEEVSGVVDIASCQPPYSMLKRDIEADVLPWCKSHNVGAIVYSPMQRGLLTGKITPDREFGEGDNRATNPMFSQANRKTVLDFLESIRPIAEKHNASFAQLAVNWAFSQPGVTASLVGARNVKQATENAAAADFELSSEDLAFIEEKLTGVKLEL